MFLPFHNKLLHCYIAKLLKLKSNVTISAASLADPDISEERLWHLPRRPADIKQCNNGFSLIELLTVITIIGILVAVATVSYTNVQQKARDGKRKSDLKSIQQALELYFQTNGNYPFAFNGNILCVTPHDTKTITWGTKFSCTTGGTNEIVYLDPLPKDPVSQTGSNGYAYSDPSGIQQKYQISAKLENTNDPEYCVSTGSNCSSGATPKLPCEPSSGRSYCVKNP